MCLDTGCSTIIADHAWLTTFAPDVVILNDRDRTMRAVGTVTTLTERAKVSIRIHGVVDGVGKVASLDLVVLPIWKLQ